MEKTYLAVAEGEFENYCGSYRNFLVKSRDNNKVKVVPEDIPGSFEAVLQYNVIDSRSRMTLLKINLVTGRPHQIRVQLSHNGHPIVGDVKYGNGRKNGLTDSLALWSYRLAFKHPVRDEIMTFTSAPPACHPWNLFDIS